MKHWIWSMGWKVKKQRAANYGCGMAPRTSVFKNPLWSPLFVIPQTGSHLYGVLTPFKGLHLWATWFCLCLWACISIWVPSAAGVFTCIPHFSPTLGALGRMSLHLSPACLPLVSHTCLPLWVLLVLWAAWFYTCLSHLSPTLGA